MEIIHKIHIFATMVKMARNRVGKILIYLLSALFLMSTTGIVFFEHHCQCTNQTFLTIIEEFPCCESNRAVEIEKDAQACCETTAGHDACPVQTEGHPCCHSEKLNPGKNRLIKRNDKVKIS